MESVLLALTGGGLQSGVRQDHSQLQKERCQSQNLGHSEKFGLNPC